MLQRTLGRRGYRVVGASSVAEALQIFRQEQIDVIVSDIGLPDGTGLELMEQVRQIREVPAIALSGYGMESDLTSSKAAGFDEHLTKPVNWPQLDAALSRILFAAKTPANR